MAKQITKFDRTNLKTIRAEIDNALATVLAKHGLSVSVGRITFTANDFSAKINVGCGSNDDAAEREFEQYARRFGLTGKEFGKSFKRGQRTFTICGIAPRSHKYPVLAKDAAGKTFKFTADSAKAAA